MYSPQPLLLNIKLLSGNLLPIWTSPLETVGQLKLRIQQVVYIPPIQQVLLLRGQRLEDYQVLSQLGLPSGSVLFLVIRFS